MADKDVKSAKKARARTVLIVDGNHAALTHAALLIGGMGFKILTASSGNGALEIMRRQGVTIDVAVLDHDLSDIAGQALLSMMRQDPVLRAIPTIVQTPVYEPAHISDALDAGAFYYIMKPCDPRILQSLLNAAVRERTEKIASGLISSRQLHAMTLIDTASFEFRSLKDAESLAAFLSHLFPEPERVVTGLAELMINAVEHGNLEIGYEEKARLLAEGVWREEIEKRLDAMPYRSRRATAAVTRKDNGIYVVVSDQGKGFQWQNYLRLEPERAGAAHGRGIAHAHLLCFDKLTYNKEGNKAVAYVRA